MIVLAGADLVLPDRVVPAGTLHIEDGRIVRVEAHQSRAGDPTPAFAGHTIVPGFVDVHVHGVAGIDTLDGRGAIGRMAGCLPSFGVTAFCPTTVACAPDALGAVLEEVRHCRTHPSPLAARVLPAHIESNFINPGYRGAQPLQCLRTGVRAEPADGGRGAAGRVTGSFTTAELLHVIERAADAVGIVTLAPEIEGGLDLVAWFVALGVRVSLGHSGANYQQAVAAIAAGARQATHLFNRMPPLHHREPGLVAAILESRDVAAEVICDGVHVHPSMVRVAARAMTSRIMAITDGTAAAALPAGTPVHLGGQSIVNAGSCARLEDGTMAGSVLTMDEAFRRLTGPMGFPMVEAVQMCASTPARVLGLDGVGVLAAGAVADLCVLDDKGQVVQTYIGGRLVYGRGVHQGNGVPPQSV